jgi:hypothetical protein
MPVNPEPSRNKVAGSGVAMASAAAAKAVCVTARTSPKKVIFIVPECRSEKHFEYITG